MRVTSIVTITALLFTASASADSCRQAQTTDWNLLNGVKRNIILTNAAKALNVQPYSWTRVFFIPGAGQLSGTICADGWNVNATQIGEPSRCDASAAFITVTGNATGYAEVQIDSGDEVTTSTTVSESATHSAGLDVDLNLDLGASVLMAGISRKVMTTVTADFTTGTAQTIDETSDQTVSIYRLVEGLGPGKTCQISIEHATCRFRARAYVPLTLSGWLGIEFATAFKVRDDRPALKTWYVNLAKVALGPTRSQMLPLNITGSMVAMGSTDATCKTQDSGVLLPARVIAKTATSARRPVVTVRKAAARAAAARRSDLRDTVPDDTIDGEA
ncbi:hypothetical protein HDU89_000877 [Geranomyces variabilis]|nr:hypothetical protein HDU89_000877 [Geranomyces variabilis]